MAQAATKPEPCTPEQIVDLIRAPHPRYVSGHAISTAEAMELIEQYAAVAAAEASIKATDEAFSKCLAISAAALSAPLTSPPDTAVSP